MNAKIILAALLLVLLGGGFYLATQGRTPAAPEGWACTSDALLCPDGSGVGREGPSCVFSACPNQESFTGELSEQGGEFRLIIPAPQGAAGATYAMPVEFRVSNAVQDLLGRQVKVRGTFVFGNTLRVDTMEPVPSENPAPQVNVGTIRIGETKLVGHVKITLNGISEDSRCPIDAVCIWAGQVTANVTLESDTDKETVEISTDKPAHGFASYSVSITNVAPSKMASVPTAPSEYRVTFKTEPLRP